MKKKRSILYLELRSKYQNFEHRRLTVLLGARRMVSDQILKPAVASGETPVMSPRKPHSPLLTPPNLSAFNSDGWKKLLSWMFLPRLTEKCNSTLEKHKLFPQDFPLPWALGVSLPHPLSLPLCLSVSLPLSCLAYWSTKCFPNIPPHFLHVLFLLHWGTFGSTEGKSSR